MTQLGTHTGTIHATPAPHPQPRGQRETSLATSLAECCKSARQLVFSFGQTGYRTQPRYRYFVRHGIYCATKVRSGAKYWRHLVDDIRQPAHPLTATIAVVAGYFTEHNAGVTNMILELGKVSVETKGIPSGTATEHIGTQVIYYTL